jgi:hypothetical protein
MINQFALNMAAEFRNLRQTTSLPWKSEAKTIVTFAKLDADVTAGLSVFQDL